MKKCEAHEELMYIVKDIKEDLKKNNETTSEIYKKLSNMEGKSTVWAMVGGGIFSAIFTSIGYVVLYFKNKL